MEQGRKDGAGVDKWGEVGGHGKKRSLITGRASSRREGGRARNEAGAEGRGGRRHTFSWRLCY